MMHIEVDVKRDTILEQLIENKAKHQVEYTEAVEGYLSAKWEKIKNLYNKFDDGSIEGDVDVPLNFGLQKPVDNSVKYDELINTFEMVSDEIIKLSFEDAKNIANDSFQWVGAAKFINAMYSNAR